MLDIFMEEPKNTNSTMLLHQLEETKQKQKQEQEQEQEQDIWSWGAGTEGQLATAKLEDEQTPQIIHSLSSLGPISSLSCGGAHVIALTPSGRVLTWGRGTSGQLGHGDMVNVLRPKVVEAFEGFVMKHFSAGWNHSGFVSGSGALFTCGDGSFGQLGHGDYKSQSSPTEVTYFSSNHVEQVACGMRHSLVLLRGNVEHQVYAFGSGKRGQLGISEEKVKSTSLPQITMGFMNVKLASISANGDHSAALSADGSLYAWGRGFGSASDACIPRQFNSDFSFNQVALGWNHALLLTSTKRLVSKPSSISLTHKTYAKKNIWYVTIRYWVCFVGEGEVFMLGGDRHGALSDSQKTFLRSCASGKSQETQLQKVPGLMESKVLQISAGAEHSALVTDNGTVMAWGWGEHGQLGLGDTNDRTGPQVVSLGHMSTENDSIPRVYCGSGFTFVLGHI